MYKATNALRLFSLSFFDASPKQAHETRFPAPLICLFRPEIKNSTSARPSSAASAKMFALC